MAAIDGLTEEQCVALAGVQVGDLVFVLSFPKYDFENEESQDESDDVDEEEVSEGEHDGNSTNSHGAEDGHHVNTWDTRPAEDAHDVDLADAQDAEGEHDGDSANSDGAEDDHDVDTEDTQPANDGHDVEFADAWDTEGEHDADAGSASSEGENGNGQEEGNAPNPWDEHAQDVKWGEGDADEAHEDQQEDVYDSDDAYPAPQGSVYSVYSITKGDDETITDIKLCLVHYRLKPSEATSPSYHIYGTDIVHNTNLAGAALAGIPTDIIEAEYIHALKDLVKEESMEHVIRVKCDGDDLRNEQYNYACPASCNDGWINTQEEMHELVSENINLVTAYRPVCPVCIGKDLTMEFQALREELETNPQIDLGKVVDFYFGLAPRRSELGYGFKQFDEREWGYLFDDMLPEDHDRHGRDDSENDGANWGYWPEALDPASCPVYHPTKDDVIASLPRKTYAEVKVTEEEIECPVCKETLTDDVVVAELPCGHFFCDAGCIEWLRQSNTCPTCRMKLPSVDEDKEDEQEDEQEDGFLLEENADSDEDEDEEDDDDQPDTPDLVEDDGDAEGGDGVDEELNDDHEALSGAEDDVDDDAESIEKDGEDVVMSDANVSW